MLTVYSNTVSMFPSAATESMVYGSVREEMEETGEASDEATEFLFSNSP